MRKFNAITLGLLLSIGSLNIAFGHQSNNANEMGYACTNLVVDVTLSSFIISNPQGLSLNFNNTTVSYPSFISSHDYTLILHFNIKTQTGQYLVIPARSYDRSSELFTIEEQGTGQVYVNSDNFEIIGRRLVSRAVEDGLQQIAVFIGENCNSAAYPIVHLDPLPSTIIRNYADQLALAEAENPDSITCDSCTDISGFISNSFMTLAPEYGFTIYPR